MPRSSVRDVAKKESIKTINVPFVTWNFILLIKKGNNSIFILKKEEFYIFLKHLCAWKKYLAVTRKPPCRYVEKRTI